MFDHVGVVVRDLAVSGRFYTACLAPLGYRLLADFSQPDGDGRLVYGSGGPADPFFVVAHGMPTFWRTDHVAGAAPDHIGFQAPSRESVDAFYRAGLDNGGRDNGPPGPRRSSTRYYAAYLIDPDSNNVEAGYRGE